MPDNDDFSSLFDDEKSSDVNKTENKKEVDSSSSMGFDDYSDEEELNPYNEKDDVIVESSDKNEDAVLNESLEKKVVDAVPVQVRKRTSEDFEPDMDAVLITAESSMIIEGMKHLSNKIYSSESLPRYIESIKGIDLYIKILDRNPDNYIKLSEIISQDTDCKEVEKIAFNIYKAGYKEEPSTDDQKLKAFEMFREGLRTGYNKALINNAMGEIKDYFLQSGGLDEFKVTNMQNSKDVKLVKSIVKLNKLVKVGLNLLKTGRGEISKGMKGRNLNIFLIKSTDLLSYYYNISGNYDMAKYYKRLNENQKKYFVMK